MSQSVAPLLKQLSQQFYGVFTYFQQMLDDEFMFASAGQVPQAATIFDLVHDRTLPFGEFRVSLPELLALIAYRYGFWGIRRIGHGGYAVVVGHDRASEANNAALPVTEPRRVLRLVPEHHVQDVTGTSTYQRSFDVRLDAENQPIRDLTYPLLLSDLFLLPRHTTKLVFQDALGLITQAGGRPAILRCQLLPEVIPMNASGLNQIMAQEAGELLEAALATLGVNVADAHGGNGGVLVDKSGQPLIFKRDLGNGIMKDQYIPVVLDYGYYSEIGPKSLTNVLLRHGVSLQMMQQFIASSGLAVATCEVLIKQLGDESRSLAQRFAAVIEQSGLERAAFGKLLYEVKPPVFSPEIWIDLSEAQWKTVKEKSYPPLQDQSRPTTIYPAYDEMLFPQHIEEYHFRIYED